MLTNVIESLMVFYELHHNPSGTISAYYNSQKENRHTAQAAVRDYISKWEEFSRINYATDGVMYRVFSDVVNTLILNYNPKSVPADMWANLPVICEMAFFIRMLDIQPNTHTTIRAPNDNKPYVEFTLDGDLSPVAAVLAKDPLNKLRLDLVSETNALSNFWHAIPAGTYQFGLFEDCWVVSH